MGALELSFQTTRFDPDGWDPGSEHPEVVQEADEASKEDVVS